MPKGKGAFFQREKIASLRRIPILALWRITKSPFMLYEQATDPLSSQDLLALITNKFRDKIQENGIELREMQETLVEGKRS